MNYEIAQQRIAEAHRTNSPRLNLSKFGLAELCSGPQNLDT